MATKSTSKRGRELLEECTLFSALDQRARHEIAAYARPRKFIAGESICSSTNAGDSMMAVVLGTVRISLPAIKGKEIILANLQAGEFFGEIALLDGKTRSANATAHTKCELMVLDRRNLLPFLERNPVARRHTDGDALRAHPPFRRADGRYCISQLKSAACQDNPALPEG